jgi:serine/threonine-protein kinase
MNFGRYQVLGEIGKGSMGVVYKARDPNLDLTMALKVMRKDRVASEPFVRRFLAEAKALGRLDHANIVRVFNVDSEGDHVYIVMEFIEGDSFSDLMKSEQFTPEEIVEFGAIMADALDYAHKKGIVHRDVKPSNILCAADGRLKITDFGIAHIDDLSAAEETQAGEILGTPAYMSPEQVLGRPVDGRSDLFSLGIILYELAARTRPFGGENLNVIFNAITTVTPVNITTLNRAIPAKLAETIMKCLEKSPEARFADGKELAAALRSSLATGSVAPPPSATEDTKKPGMKPLTMAILVCCVLSVAGLVFYGMSGKSTSPSGQQAVQTPASTQQVPVTAILKADSTPAGAEIIVDGASKGITPVRLTLTPGKHEVRLMLDRYEVWDAQIELDKDAETPLNAKLIPKNQ